MRVYISGKIGEEVISDATRQKFAKAEKMLLDRGYDVFNPTQKDWQDELHRGYQLDSAILPYGEKVTFYAYALLRDLMVLATCDAVYYLADWEKSCGAGTEMSFALATGKKQLWQVLEHARLNRSDEETAEEVWLPIEAEEVVV